MANPVIADTAYFLSIVFSISLDYSLNKISSKCQFPSFASSDKVQYTL